MRNGICPKCGWNDVRVGQQETVTVGQLERLPVGVRITGQFYINPTMFVCLRCSYTEYYTFEPRDLQNIAERWPRVTHPQNTQG